MEVELKLCWAIWAVVVVETGRSPSHPTGLDPPVYTTRRHGSSGVGWNAGLPMYGGPQVAARRLKVTVGWEGCNCATPPLPDLPAAVDDAWTSPRPRALGHMSFKCAGGVM